MRRASFLLAACFLAMPARAVTVEANEPLVMRLIFEDCLGFIRHGRTPFAGLATRPAPRQVADQFPARMPDRNQIVELLSPRYAAAWGGDGNSRHCLVRTVLDPWPPPGPALLGVDPHGFIARVTERATAEGLTEHSSETEFSPLVVPSWAEPATGHDSGPLRPVTLTAMPTGGNDDGSVVDAGLIVMGGPP